MVRCFLFRLGCHFLMFDRERTVVRGHFPVMLSRNRVRRLFGRLVEHSGTLNQILGVRHGDTSWPTNLCKRRAQARAGRSGFKRMCGQPAGMAAGGEVKAIWEPQVGYSTPLRLICRTGRLWARVSSIPLRVTRTPSTMIALVRIALSRPYTFVVL